MGNETSVGAVLSAICRRCPHLADEVLDVHSGVKRQCSPGQCARAFFRVWEEAGEEMPREVQAMKRSVSELLAVEAAKSEGEVLERVEFHPEKGEGLEDFCHRMMRFFHLDRAYEAQELRLRFCYQ